MTDDSLHKQSPKDDAPQESSVSSESPPQKKSSQRSYATLAEGTDGEVRPVPRRRLSLNWVLLVLVVVVWSGAVGFYLSSFSTMPSAPPVAMEPSAEETRLPFPSRSSVKTAPLASDMAAADLSALEAAGSDLEVPPDSEAPVAAAGAVAESAYQLIIGPFVDSQAQQQAVAYLKQQDMTAEQIRGEGPVRMIRLFVGSYPPAEAGQQLQRLQAAVPSAFGLPDNGRRALYAASFQSRGRADALQKTLAEGGITVTQQAAEVTMTGNLLVIKQADQKTAEGITRYFEDSGISVRSEKQQP